MASATSTPGPSHSLGGPAAAQRPNTPNGGIEELLPLVMQLTNAEQVINFYLLPNLLHFCENSSSFCIVFTR